MKLDLVGSTVRYEVMELVIDVTGSEEGIYAYIEQRGDLDRYYRCLTMCLLADV